MSSSTSWWELSLEVPAWLVDDLCGVMLYHGALGASLTSRDLPAPPIDGQPLCTPTKTEHELIYVSFDAEQTKEEVLDKGDAAVGEFGLQLKAMGAELRKRTDTGWAEAWKSFFKPLRFGKDLWVVPRWETHEENEAMMEKLALEAGAKVVHLEPGLAFGTGQHATTSLCLTLLTELLKVAPSRMLDVGCGSGILSIAAAKLGVTDILAVDNDSLAVKIAQENSVANQVDSQIRTSEAPIETNAEHFPLVVANIIAPVLIALAEPISKAVSPDGLLVLSGMLEEQVAEVKRVYSALTPSLQWESHNSEGEWHALVARF